MRVKRGERRRQTYVKADYVHESKAGMKVAMKQKGRKGMRGRLNVRGCE